MTKETAKEKHAREQKERFNRIAAAVMAKSNDTITVKESEAGARILINFVEFLLKAYQEQIDEEQAEKLAKREKQEKIKANSCNKSTEAQKVIENLA